MGRKLFGTDGIRGKANIYPMTPEIAMALGRAVTYFFQKRANRNKQPLIIVGKDTRLSCYMLEQAFSAGVCAQGGQVVLTGPLPTPAVSFVTQSMRADAGVMISASHNQYSDNGIKIFDWEGHKLPDETELELEQLVLNPETIPVHLGDGLGRARRLDEVMGRYIVNVKSAFQSNYDLEGLRIVLDCANGAGYKVGPMIFSELGADVFTLGVNPNGMNINAKVGSLHPESCQEKVHETRADLGICLDGDADRVVMVDEKGRVVDGDKLIGVLAKLMLDEGKLQKGSKVVGTVMSNLGLEKYLETLGLGLERTKVGDRYIIEKMTKDDLLIGGEPSGHVILKEFCTTGDGILVALKVIEAMRFYKKSLSELVDEVDLFPQVVKSTKITSKPPLDSVVPIQKQLKEAEKQLGQSGRILLRYSGTEPLARVMIEGEDEVLVEQLCSDLTATVAKELGN